MSDVVVALEVLIARDPDVEAWAGRLVAGGVGSVLLHRYRSLRPQRGEAWDAGWRHPSLLAPVAWLDNALETCVLVEGGRGSVLSPEILNTHELRRQALLDLVAVLSWLHLRGACHGDLRWSWLIRSPRGELRLGGVGVHTDDGGPRGDLRRLGTMVLELEIDWPRPTAWTALGQDLQSSVVDDAEALRERILAVENPGKRRERAPRRSTVGVTTRVCPRSPFAWPAPLRVLAAAMADDGEAALEAWRALPTAEATWRGGEVWLELPAASSAHDPDGTSTASEQDRHAEATLTSAERILDASVEYRPERTLRELRDWMPQLELVLARSTETSTRLRAMVLLALAFDAGERASRAENHTQAMFDLARRDGIRLPLRASALLAAARLRRLDRHIAEALELVDEALPLLPEGSQVWTDALTQRAELLVNNGRPAEGLSTLNRARAAALTARAWVSLFETSYVGSAALDATGDAVGSRRLAEHDLALARALGWEAAEATVLQGQIVRLLPLDPHGSLGLAERAVALARRAGESRIGQACALKAAMAALAVGDVDKAEQHLDSIRPSLGQQLEMSVRLRRLWVSAARWEEADHTFRWTDDALRQAWTPTLRFEILTQRGTAQHVVGLSTEAQHSLQQAAQLSQEQGWRAMDVEAFRARLSELLALDPGVHPPYLSDESIPRDERELLAVARGVRLARLRRTPTRVLTIGPDFAWVRVGQEPEITLPARGPGRGILALLVDTHARDPVRSLHREELMAAGWPGERILPEAALNRFHVFLTKLRSRGLRDVLETRQDGYALRADVRVRR